MDGGKIRTGNTNLQKTEKHLFLHVSSTTRLAGCFINGDAD
jgi:hypothetical protein